MEKVICSHCDNEMKNFEASYNSRNGQIEVEVYCDECGHTFFTYVELGQFIVDTDSDAKLIIS
jgi:RNase P subunit RPR2